MFTFDKMPGFVTLNKKFVSFLYAAPVIVI